MMIDIVIELFFIAMIIACIAAFIVTLLHKWGAVEYMQVHADDFPEVVNKLFSCDFCICWWCCVLVSFVALFITFNFSVLLCPVFATPIAKFLLR